MERFVCVNGSDNLQIPGDVLESLEIRELTDVHLRADRIVEVSRRMKAGGWIRLPFCNTLCCEALGAVPVLSLSGARVKEPPYRRAEELPDRLKAETERLTAMLSAVELLAGEGNCVAYNIEGPFTLLCSLLPMNRVFSALRKEEGVKLLEKAESWVCDYAALAVGRGVRLLSFADPVAAVDILGEKMFSSVYVPSLKRVLDRLRSEFPDTPIHLCGKLSQCLLDTRFCTAERRESEGRCASYGEALSSFCETGQNGVIGHFCLNYLKAKRTYLTLLEL